MESRVDKIMSKMLNADLCAAAVEHRLRMSHREEVEMTN